MSQLFVSENNYLIVKCDFAEKSIVKQVGGIFDRNLKAWLMPFTSYNVEFLIENLPDVAVSDDFSDKLQKQIEREQRLEQIRKMAKADKPIKFKIPGLKEDVDLFNYQKLGVLFALTNPTGVLLGDMCGLGKTSQAIATAVYKKYKEGIKNCLIITPASLKWNWPLEIKKFTNEKFIVIDGTPQERLKQWMVDDVFFYITNFEMIIEDLFGGKNFKVKDENDEEEKRRKEKLKERSAMRALKLEEIRNRIWDQIVVDECFHPDTRILLANGKRESISKIVVNNLPVKVLSFNEKTHEIEANGVVNWHRNSIKQCYKVVTDGHNCYSSLNHRFMTPNGYKTLSDLKVDDEIMFLDETGISKEHLDILAGTLLGDGCLSRHNAKSINKKARLSFTHGLKQKKYAIWKAGFFGSFTTGTGKKLVRTATKSIFCRTDYNKFIRKGKKHITKEWLDCISELGLAFWFMDDGSITNNDYCHFNTEGFSKKECKILSFWLQEKFQIESSVYNAGRGYFKVSTTVAGYRRLCELIGKYVHPTMRYKLGSWEPFVSKFDLKNNLKCFEIKARIRVSKIYEISKYKEPCTTYNMEVENNHNYFAGSALVSNCHSLKSHDSRRSKCCKSLKANYKMGLSGTPIDGKLEELHSIYEFIQPGLFENKTLFLQKHATFDFYGRITEYKKIGEVRKRIQPFFLRRLKSEVLKDLPPKIYQNRYVVFSKEEQKIYDDIASKAHSLTENSEVMETIIRCKQFCNHPELIGLPAKTSSKLESFKEIVEELVIKNGNKIIVFSQYAKMCALLNKVFDGMGLKYYYIWADTDKKERAAMQVKFNEDPSIDLMIGTDAMSTGLNFTAASYVINYDDFWSPSIMEQREDRAHRYGQKSTVNVINFICKDTIEERIRTTLYNKSKISSDVLGDMTDDAVLKRLGPLDIAKLL